MTPMLLLLLAASPTSSDRLGVVFVVEPELRLRVSDLYAAVERTVSRESTLQLAPFDLFTALASRDASRACAGDAHCFVDVAARTGAQLDLLLIVSVAQLDEALFVALRLIRTDSAAPEVAAHTQPIDPAVAVHRALGPLLSHVFPEALWQPPARLSVTSTPAGAEARVGARICRTPCTFDRLEAGRHTVSIVHEDHRPWSGARDLTAGETAKIEEMLQPIPSAWYDGPWVWGAAAVVVVGAIVTGVVVASDRGAVDRVCVWHDPSAC